MGKLLIIAVVLVALVAGMFAGLTAFGIVPDFLGLGLGPQETVEQVAEEPEPEPMASPKFIEFKNLSVPIIINGRVKSTFFVAFRIQVVDESRVELASKERRFKDVIMRYLHDFLPRHMQDRETPDLVELKKRMKAVADRLAGPDENGNSQIIDVLITSAYTQ